MFFKNKYIVTRTQRKATAIYRATGYIKPNPASKDDGEAEKTSKHLNKKVYIKGDIIRYHSGPSEMYTLQSKA